jgi:hypothetical protein
MEVRTESLPDAADEVAFVYGPVVLAGDLGPGPKTETVPYSADHRTNLSAEAAAVPILVRGTRPLAEALSRDPGLPLAFRFSGLGHPLDLTLRPFWEISHDRYSVYWATLTEAQWRYRDAPAPAGQ